MPSPTFRPGDPVRIHRPHKKDHGAIGRYYAPGQDPAFAWVSFHKKQPEQLPPADKLRRQEDYPRRLYPLTHLLPYEPQR